MNRIRHNHCNPGCALLIFCVAIGTARAQDAAIPDADSRAGVLAGQVTAKANKAAPYVPDRVEALFHRIEKILLTEPSGWYPYFGSVYQGGGFTVGAGYRKFFGDNTSWYGQGLYSFSNYKLIEGGSESKDH